jgi:hypothetical protein
MMGETKYSGETTFRSKAGAAAQISALLAEQPVLMPDS